MGFFRQKFFRSTPFVLTDTDTRNLLSFDDFVTLPLVVLAYVFQISLKFFYAKTAQILLSLPAIQRIYLATRRRKKFGSL